MLDAHPFDFLVATVKDHRRHVAKIKEELQQAEAELREASKALREFVERAER